MGKPCGQLLALDVVVFRFGFACHFAGFLGARGGRVGFAFQVRLRRSPAQEGFKQTQRQANTGGPVFGFFGGPCFDNWRSQVGKAQRQQFSQRPRHGLDAGQALTLHAPSLRHLYVVTVIEFTPKRAALF